MFFSDLCHQISWTQNTRFAEENPCLSSKSHGRVHHESWPSCYLPPFWDLATNPRLAHKFLYVSPSVRLFLSTCVLNKTQNEHACSQHLTNHHDMACAKHMNQMSHNLDLMSGIRETWDLHARGLRTSAQKMSWFLCMGVCAWMCPYCFRKWHNWKRIVSIWGRL